MQVLFVISCVVLLLYVAMIIAFFVGWQRIPSFVSEKKTESMPKVSLIVCCRDEERYLPTLLKSISSQSYENFEVIFVNDYSTDKTADLLAEYAKTHRNVTVFVPKKSGKKSALREAVDVASGELICCTDADCVLRENHIALFAEYYAFTHVDMILGGVRMLYDSSLFGKLQALEFLSLQASTIGSVGVGCPIMCNGANMAFTKKIWEQANAELCMKTPSGDDEFLLFAIKKNGGRIGFIKNPETIVATRACATVKAFFSQRTRWTSKSIYYNDVQTIAVALLVFFTTLVVLFWGISACFSKESLLVFLALFLIKFIADTLFLCAVFPFFKEQKLCKYTFLLSIVYPFYVLSSVFGGFLSSKTWKNRIFR